jgi:hypothetical protein
MDEALPMTVRVLLAAALLASPLGCRTGEVEEAGEPERLFRDPAFEETWKEILEAGNDAGARCEKGLEDLAASRSKSSRAAAWSRMADGYKALRAAVVRADAFVLKRQARIAPGALSRCSRRIARWSALLFRVRKHLPLEVLERIEPVPEEDLADPRNRIR